MIKKKLNNFIQSFRKKGIKLTVKKYLFIKPYVNWVCLLNYKRLKNDWKSVKDKYEGERVFLIGNGPSLNETALYMLKDEYTMCFNRFNVMFERINWLPSFYACTDDLVAHNISSDINNEIVPKVQYAFFPLIHNRGTDFRNFINDKENILWLCPKSDDNKINLPISTTGPTVAYPALDILIYLGFSEIYIIGMDMNYQIHNTAKELSGLEIEAQDDDDPNHFDPRYFGKGKQYHQPVQKTVDNILNAMVTANKKACRTKTSIYNATYGGKVEAFKRVNFDSLFSFSDSEKLKLFVSSMNLDINNKNELLRKFPLKKSIDEIAGLMYFSLSKSYAVSKIKDLLLDYIPFGPYEEMFFFIRRDKRLEIN